MAPFHTVKVSAGQKGTWLAGSDLIQIIVSFCVLVWEAASVSAAGSKEKKELFTGFAV